MLIIGLKTRILANKKDYATECRRNLRGLILHKAAFQVVIAIIIEAL